jgi:hypothetical protein
MEEIKIAILEMEEGMPGIWETMEAEAMADIIRTRTSEGTPTEIRWMAVIDTEIAAEI